MVGQSRQGRHVFFLFLFQSLSRHPVVPPFPSFPSSSILLPKLPSLFFDSPLL
jgi:hypothetical protein